MLDVEAKESGFKSCPECKSNNRGNHYPDNGCDHRATQFIDMWDRIALEHEVHYVV